MATTAVAAAAAVAGASVAATISKLLNWNEMPDNWIARSKLRAGRALLCSALPKATQQSSCGGKCGVDVGGGMLHVVVDDDDLLTPTAAKCDWRRHCVEQSLHCYHSFLCRFRCHSHYLHPSLSSSLSLFGCCWRCLCFGQGCHHFNLRESAERFQN